ncbi:MAG TPA: hypothetical protein VEY95_11345 [Azospirillaceae bacterium]|nr:hypothetical protein [Azospirillaceae bacterium]
MIQTLINIMRQEREDLVRRISREEQAPSPDPERLECLRREAESLDRQLERLADR